MGAAWRTSYYQKRNLAAQTRRVPAAPAPLQAHFDSNREMIRSGDVQYLAVFGFDGTLYKNPVQRSGDHVCSDALIAQDAAETRFAQPGNQARMKGKAVEVAGDDNRSLSGIALGIG